MKNFGKTIGLFIITPEKGYTARVVQYIGRKGEVCGSYLNYSKQKKYSEKTKIRTNDHSWVAHNIPSSFWWKYELHHDWKDSGRLYFLTHKEHIEHTRKERVTSQ